MSDMTSREYLNAQQLLQMVAGMLSAIDIDAFLARIDAAETVGPIVDPTLFREAMGKLEKVKHLAMAARPLIKEAQRQLEEEDD